MTSSYHRGRQAEWRCRDELTKQGYLVTRASSSKGAHDIVAVNATRVLFISLKSTTKESYAKRTLAAERKRLAAVTVPASCRQEIWIWLHGKGWWCQQTVEDVTPTP